MPSTEEGNTNPSLFSPKHEIGLKLILLIAGNEIISAWDRAAATFRCAGSTCDTSSGRGNNQEEKKEGKRVNRGLEGLWGKLTSQHAFLAPRGTDTRKLCPETAPTGWEIECHRTTEWYFGFHNSFKTREREQNKTPASSSIDEIAHNSKFTQQIPILSHTGYPSSWPEALSVRGAQRRPTHRRARGANDSRSRAAPPGASRAPRQRTPRHQERSARCPAAGCALPAYTRTRSARRGFGSGRSQRAHGRPAAAPERSRCAPRAPEDGDGGARKDPGPRGRSLASPFTAFPSFHQGKFSRAIVPISSRQHAFT